MICNFLSAGHQRVVRNDLVDEVHAKRLFRVEWLIGQQDAHYISVGDLLHQVGSAGPVAHPALAEQCELEARVLRTGDADVGGCEHEVEASACRPAVDGANDGFPYLRVVIAEPPVCADLGGAVHRAGRRPEYRLGADALALFGSDVRACCEVVSGAEVTVALARQDGYSHIPIVPDLLPDLRNLVRSRSVEDVRLLRVVDGYIGDIASLLVLHCHLSTS